MTILLRVDTPTEPFIETSLVREWAKLDDAEPDGIINLAVKAAVQKAEHTTGQLFTRQQWQASVPAGGTVSLRQLSPLIEVKQDNQVLLVQNDSNMIVESLSNSPIIITCGYEQMPEAVQMWVFQRVGFWLENRQMLTSGANLFEPPRDFIDGLLDPYIIHPL